MVSHALDQRFPTFFCRGTPSEWSMSGVEGGGRSLGAACGSEPRSGGGETGSASGFSTPPLGPSKVPAGVYVCLVENRCPRHMFYPLNCRAEGIIN